MNKKEFTKSCLADSLFELLKVKDYKKISIEDIVQKSGFSRMSYYRNFSSIEEIAEYYLDVKMEDMLNIKNKSIKASTPREYVIGIFSHLYENRFITEIYFKQGLYIPMKRQFEKHLVKKVNDESHYFFSFVSGGLFHVFLDWVNNNYKESPELLADTILSMIKIKIAND